MATLTYTKQNRVLDLRGVITLTDGSQINLTTDDILSYSISESSGSDGLPLGSAEASSYTLTISNVSKSYTPDMFDNAEVHMTIYIENGSTFSSTSFGVWYVSDVSAPEQGVAIDLSGEDALSTLFEVNYTDDKSAYPTTLGSLATAICAAAGISIKSSSFRNANIQVKSMPEWGDNVTLREIIGYIAACAGGFARIARDGTLEIQSYADSTTYTLDGDYYFTLTRTNGAAFKFNALEVKDEDADEETYTRYAIDTSIEDNATNTIKVEGNLLFTEGVAESVKTLLSSVQVTSLSVDWVGDPAVRIGDKLKVTDLQGNTVTMLINGQSFDFSGGLSATSECSLPTLTSQNASSYTTSGNVIDSQGNIRATRISNLDKSVISATVGHFEELTAGSVSADKLLSSIIDAITLKAENIDAKSITTDSLTTMVAKIVEATINKIVAQTITTDALFASIAELLTLKAKQITADNVSTDELATETLRVNGYATISSLVTDTANANQLIVKDATATKVFIKQLQVLSAQLAAATIGELVIKGTDADGNAAYYKLNVSDGALTYESVTPTDDEIAKGVTSDGRSAIIETSLTVDDLAASSLKAINALIDHITADRIDCTTLTARDAFINSLVTQKISSSGKTLKIIAGDAEYMDVREDGTHMKAMGTNNEMVLSSSGVSINMNGSNYSQFAANYVQFGNYQLRRTNDGGLAFKLKE